MSKSEKKKKPSKRAAKSEPAKKPELRKRTRKEPLAGALAYPGGFPLYLARYVLFGGDKPRAAMRFYNAAGVLITGLEFTLVEKDSSGRTIARTPLERRGLFAESGGEFAVADAPVSRDCAEIEVELVSAYSGGYEYAVSGDGVSVRLEEEHSRHLYTFSKKPTYSVKKRGKKYILISFLSILAVAAAAIAISWRVGLFDDVLPEQFRHKDTNDIAVQYITDVTSC